MLQVDLDGGDGEREVELGEGVGVEDAELADRLPEGDHLRAPTREEGVVILALKRAEALCCAIFMK